MGHYDNLYEMTAEDEYKTDCIKAKKSIKAALLNMDLEELEFLDNIAKNISDYITFFKILKKHK